MILLGISLRSSGEISGFYYEKIGIKYSQIQVFQATKIIWKGKLKAWGEIEKSV